MLKKHVIGFTLKNLSRELSSPSDIMSDLIERDVLFLQLAVMFKVSYVYLSKSRYFGYLQG